MGLQLPSDEEIMDAFYKEAILIEELPDFIRDLVAEAEEKEGEEEYSPFKHEPTADMVIYAIEQLKECLNRTNIYHKIAELEFLQCRLMPIPYDISNGQHWVEQLPLPGVNDPQPEKEIKIVKFTTGKSVADRRKDLE